MNFSRKPRQSELDHFYELLPPIANSGYKYIFPDAFVHDLPSGDAPVGINASALNADDELVWWLEAPTSVEGYPIQLTLEGADATSVPLVYAGTIPFDTQGLLEFKVSKADVVEGIVEVYASITNPDTDVSELTPKLKVKIDLQAPGGPVDPSGVQQNLALVTAALLIPGEISGVELQQGITFTVAPYPGMKQWDTVELKMPGATLSKRLDTAAEVNQPVVFTVPPQELLCFAGRTSVGIHYRIVDEVGNVSQPSPSAEFIIDNIQNPQAAPQFLDVNPSSDTVALAALPGPNTAVRVATSGLFVGEVVTLKWSLVTTNGTTLSGTRVETVASSSTDLTFDVPGNSGLALEAGQLTAYYEVPGRSRSSKTVATLTGALVSHPLTFGADISITASLRYIILKGRAPLHPTADSKGSYQRQGSGGQPPYTYSSSNEAVAKVNGQGVVVAQDNGVAEISVTDANQQVAKYKITFSGVRLVEVRPNQWWTGHVFHGSRPEFHSLSVLQMQSFWEQYRNDDVTKSVATILGWTQPLLWSGDNYYPAGTAYVLDFSVLNPDFRGEEKRSGGTQLPSLARVGWS
ncbi:hypothetical protein LOY44_07765 [Pseudomonas sp. B21-044]|uniref:hypothetical protein n=1 Tax=Pseudomonas sp. B21-044 TaxID=2895488 RepID=UPI00215FD23B|nr:hypothetical protein [Pseudomonas sp. B21-044]UVL20781.1 hypothetical protein LOY44_07765 [Pseudomonas sp. B21-044]